MKENKVQEFLNDVFGEVRAFKENGQIWFCANDVLKILEYAESGWINKVKRLKQNGVTKRECRDKLGRSQMANFVDEENTYILIVDSKNTTEEKKKQLIDWFKSIGVFKEVFVSSRKETLFIDKLEKSLKPFCVKGIEQYPILTYRIDFYIPSLNIAIEYDENNHASYTYEQHELRQELIEKELGCRFIRVNDKESDEYNIGYIIKEMFNVEVA